MRNWIGAAVAASLFASPALAQEAIKIANIAELSGPGAVVGSNWKNGVDLAVAEINAKGGILKRPIEVTHFDNQTNPGVARAQVQKALDSQPYALFGPVYSGNVKVTMTLAEQAEVPIIIGGEASELTHMGNAYVFRTSLGQQASMPKIANYIRDTLKAKNVAVVWINNDFGKGGRDNFKKEMESRGIKVVADISTEQGQADFAADVVKTKSANADAVFVYLNEEESARFLREAKKQGLTVPLLGETTLLSQKVIDLAGDAADGVKGHIGLSVDIPVEAVGEFKTKYEKKFGFLPDHNGIKGYLAVYAVKYATEKNGKVDSKLLAQTLHGLTITPKDEPGILIETTWDDKGDVDRISFLAEVVDGKQKIIATLPKIGK
jgi:branched-chain amino acid transport system substrate-binding protein